MRNLWVILLLLGGCDQNENHEHQAELKLVPLEKAEFSGANKQWLKALPAYSQSYDPLADPHQSLQAAVQDAAKNNKEIFMVVGGDWCSWCHVMSKFFHQQTEVRELLLQHYVLLKVNMSEENDNSDFLAEYPVINGYPHVFILSGSGELKFSANTANLEQGNSYSVSKFEAFLERWKRAK